MITANLDKVEAQWKSKYEKIASPLRVESYYENLYKYDWKANENNEDLMLFLPAYIESAMIKGYLVAINDFRQMIEGVDVDVSDILNEPKES